MTDSPPDCETILDRVEEIYPLLDETAAESEKARALCPQAVEALHQKVAHSRKVASHQHVQSGCQCCHLSPIPAAELLCPRRFHYRSKVLRRGSWHGRNAPGHMGLWMSDLIHRPQSSLEQFARVLLRHRVNCVLRNP